MSDSTTPGWYPDPERPGATRYWDGTAWAPSSPAGPGPAAQPFAAAPPSAYPGAPAYGGAPGYGGGAPGYGAPVQTKTDGFAIAALVLSIIGGLLLAVIFAFVARGRIKRSHGAVTGKGLTTAALVISGLWLVGIAGLVALGASGVLDHDNADDFEGEEREVAVVIDRWEDASASEICTSIYTDALREASGGDSCTANLDDRLGGSGVRQQIDIDTIVITGDEAVVDLEEGFDRFTVGLRRVDGTWRIDSITD